MWLTLVLVASVTSSALDTAINNSVAAGVTFVVGAGNSGEDASSWSPASNPNVISVAAIADSDGKCGGLGPKTPYGPDDSLASFSNFGQQSNDCRARREYT